jgi:hypothetical protein
MRDHWWTLMAERNKHLTDVTIPAPPFELSEDIHSAGSLRRSRGFIYHVVLPEDNFDSSASAITQLVSAAQKDSPNVRRSLFLDIEGHRNKRGKFDHDMLELQLRFLQQFMIQYLTEIHAPLLNLKNEKLQNNDVPGGLFIIPEVNRSTISAALDNGVNKIWMADEAATLSIDGDATARNSSVKSRTKRNAVRSAR